jgi:hypothetical protein
MNLCQKFLNNDMCIRLAAITINYHDGNLGYNLLLFRAFSVGIPLTVGFSPQLVVVSGLLVGIPLTVGFRSQLVVVSGLLVGIPLTVGFRQQLVVVSGLLVGIPLTVGFRLSRSLWLSQSPFTNSSSFTMEFWLSRSLSHELFSFFHDGILAITKPFTNFSFTWWNLGYHEAFSRNFLSHDGISGIKKPFHKFFFHMVESRLSRSLFTNFSFTCWNLGYHEAFS